MTIADLFLRTYFKSFIIKYYAVADRIPTQLLYIYLFKPIPIKEIIKYKGVTFVLHTNGVFSLSEQIVIPDDKNLKQFLKLFYSTIRILLVQDEIGLKYKPDALQ